MELEKDTATDSNLCAFLWSFMIEYIERKESHMSAMGRMPGETKFRINVLS